MGKDTEVDVDKDLMRRRLELEYELAQTGLKGTLIAVLALMMMVMILAVVGSLTHETILSGNQIVSLFGVLLIAVVAYGAFVYQRLVKLSDKLEAGNFAKRT